MPKLTEYLIEYTTKICGPYWIKLHERHIFLLSCFHSFISIFVSIFASTFHMLNEPASLKESM